MRALGISLLFVTVCGCPTSTTQTGDSGSTVDAASGTDAASATDAGPPTADTGSSACAYVDTLDRSCASDTDCTVGLHQTNCCGSSVMIAYRSTHTEVPALESQCMASYPACGCPAMLPTTDSGETVTDTSMVHAACVSVGPTMVCRTYVNNRPPNGR
jgi:hypothetical protein